MISLAGAVVGANGLPAGLIACAAIAFVPAFLDAVFGLCLGCRMDLLMLRAPDPHDLTSASASEVRTR